MTTSLLSDYDRFIIIFNLSCLWSPSTSSLWILISWASTRVLVICWRAWARTRSWGNWFGWWNIIYSPNLDIVISSKYILCQQSKIDFLRIFCLIFNTFICISLSAHIYVITISNLVIYWCSLNNINSKSNSIFNVSIGIVIK